MSLLLGLLGTTALMSATISAPIATTMSQEVEEKEEDSFHKGEEKRLIGIRQINRRISAEARAYAGYNTIQNVKTDSFKFNWIDFGVVGVKDYLRIDWTRTSFALSSELYYRNNVWGNSGTLERKTDYFTNLNVGFSFILKHDYVSEYAYGRLAENTREYSFADNFISINIDTKIWTLAQNRSAVSYASITYQNLLYDIVLKY